MLKAFERLPSDLNDDALNQVASLALFHQGYEQAEKGNWRKAVKYWQEAAQKSHNRYLAQNLAIAQEQQEEWALAANEWREMLRRRPRKEGHPDYLRDKQVAAIWEHAANCYLNVPLDDDAITCQRKAIQYDPQNLELRFKLISLLMPDAHGDTQAAIKELNGIIEIAPDNIQALTQLAHLYMTNEWRYNATPLWKKILELDPENKEARKELAWNYVEKVLPQKTGYLSRVLPFKERVKILEQGLKELPEHPDLILAMGIVHIDAHKDAEAKAYLVQAHNLAPQDAQIAAMVLQNLIHVNADAEIEQIIPQVHQIPTLLPAFWVDQGKTALDHPKWAKRFYEEALEHLKYIQVVTKASVLVDIYLSLPPEKYKDLKQIYLKKIFQETPQSGAVEFIEAISAIDVEQNIGKAKRMLHKAKRLAKAANDSGLVRQIETEEKMLNAPPPNALMDMLFNMGGMGGKKGQKQMDHILDQFLYEMQGKYGQKEMECMLEDLLDELEGGF
ncbi:tetratricopeptide TPR_2 repeat protein [Candidatus Vecturithrix granuli]|uniref:Tetratricopeptide TPR_2 repeat protein n=1 Tax=Vecturithrix granuli TaxID=1499967 RepID=A0A0S6W9N7_VECG1|nr:tetratricopeptide TPR_2 repeat protein [Candidatus Vecturithrix granuli]